LLDHVRNTFQQALSGEGQVFLAADFAPDPALMAGERPARCHAGVSMSRFRMVFVSGFVMFLVAGHAFDAWRQSDHWPFAAYPMFASVNKPQPFTSEVLVGVTRDGAEAPVTRALTSVMGINRIRPALVRKYQADMRRGLTDSPQAQAAMAELLAWYKVRRDRRADEDPPMPDLAGLRLYRLRWDFDWRAANRDAPQRTLLVAVEDQSADRPTTRVSGGE
jgi:hypothetical protein